MRRRIRGVVLFAIVACAIAAAPLAEAGRGQRLPSRATERVQPPGAAGKHRLRQTPSIVPRLGATRAPLARHAKPKSRPRVALDVVIEGAAGTVVDGPRHTYRAIRKNPFKFAAGMVVMGAIGVAGVLLNFPGEWVAVGLSSLAVAAQVKLAYPGLKKLRGAPLARGIGSDVIWPTAFFLTTWWAGHSMVGDHVAHGPPTSSQLATSFVSSAIIGGDAPAVGVTALDTAHGGTGAK